MTRLGLSVERAALPTLHFETSHLRRLSGRHGLYEHAEHDVPRRAHGYTTDDNARALVVLSHAALRHDIGARYLLPRCAAYVMQARVRRGWLNRKADSGRWAGDRGPDDTHGRALWGLGALVAAGVLVDEAAAVFANGCDLDSPHPRANAYAALGAVAVLPTGLPCAERMLESAVRCIPRFRSDRAWPWPEPRLTYANARLPEALIAAGSAIEDAGLVEQGIVLLEWLSSVESGAAGFSFTPVGGRGPGDGTPGFDQQPIEAWAMADACLRAYRVTRSAVWLDRAEQAAMWFLGHNDVGVSLYDCATGAGFDGLEERGVNSNRGAESTLAALGALCVLADCRLERRGL
jgi:hypothetical protein